MQALKTGRSCDDANGLADIPDREFAGLPVDIVAKKNALRSTGGPSQCDADEILRPEIVADLRRRFRRIIEAVLLYP